MSQRVTAVERYPEPDVEGGTASLGQRFGALFIHGLIFALGFTTLAVAVGYVFLDGAETFGLVIVASMVANLIALPLYLIVFEAYYGQTIGKRSMGIVVVKQDGSDCTWGGSIIRNILRVVDVLPNFYIIGAISAYLTSDGQRVGDIVGRTMVVETV
jgi:uncharacterized RDD family membrane protein YckC